MISLIKSKILHHCIYTLLTNRTLAFESEINNEIYNFALRFSIFIPYFNKNMFQIFNNEVKFNEIRPYSIIIAPKIERTLNDFVSIINFDKGFYEGAICPNNSFIIKEFDLKQIKSETTLFIYTFNKIKDLLLTFQPDMKKSNLIRNISEDEFIINNLISLFNEKKILSTPSYSGVGIVTFYE